MPIASAVVLSIADVLAPSSSTEVRPSRTRNVLKITIGYSGTVGLLVGLELGTDDGTVDG
jgi:hypothetical protein